MRLSVIRCVAISGRRARPGLPVFPARLSGRMIGSSKCSAARFIRSRALELERNLSPGSRRQRLNSRRTQKKHADLEWELMKGRNGKANVLTTKRSGYPSIREMLSQRASSSSSRLLLSLSLFLGLGSAQNILHRFRFSLFFAAVAPTSTSLKPLLSY